MSRLGSIALWPQGWKRPAWRPIGRTLPVIYLMRSHKSLYVAFFRSITPPFPSSRDKEKAIIVSEFEASDIIESAGIWLARVF